MADYIKKSFTFDGKRYYVYGTDDADATVKVALRRKELEEGRKQITGQTLVKDWAKEWLDTYKEPNVNRRHYKDIRNIINNFITPAIGSMKVRQVRPLHLQKILNDLTKYSDSYIDKIYDIIRQIFTEAWRNNLIMENPAESLKKPSGKKNKTRRAITDKERQLTLKVAEYHRGGLFVLIMLYCGLRPGEVAALKWCDVDMKNRIIDVHSANKSDDVIGDPKTSAGIRQVPLPNVLYERFLREKRAPFALICTNSYGGRLTESAVNTLWKNFKREMNIAAGCKMKRNQLLKPYPIADDLTLYCYRHTYCTDLQDAGVPINVAKELMGHSNIAVTAQIYTHHSEKSFNDAAALINKHNSGTVVQGEVQEAVPLENA